MSLLIFLPARGPQRRAEAGSRRRPSPQAAFERWLLQAQECFPQLRMVGITEPGRSDPLPGPCARLTLLPVSPDASRHLALELPLLSSVLRLRDPADPCWRALHACTRGNIGATVQLEWQLRGRLTGEHPQSGAGRGDFSLFPSSWPWYDGLVPLSPPPDARAHLEALLQPDFHREQRTSAQVNGARDRTRKEPPA